MFLFNLFTLLSALKVIQISDDNSKYIEEVTQSQFNETYIFLTDGSVDHYQFSIQVNTIYETVPIALAASQSQAPYFDSSHKLIYQYFDTNGYLMKKQYFYLILVKSSFPYYITVLSENTISYQIKAYSNYQQLCSERCSYFGSCYIGKCNCNKGQIGDDCSVSANQITEELTSFKSGYFYQQFKAQESINFDVTSVSDGNIYFLFETTQISVPTIDTFDYKLELKSDVPKKFSLQYPEIGAHKVIIFVPSSMKVIINQSFQCYKFTLGTDENTYDNNSPSYDDSNNNNSTLSPDSVILICTIVPALMMVLITVVICVKCRYKDRHSAFHMAIQQQQVAPQMAAQFQNGPIDYAQFPKSEGDCSICLGGFNNPSEMRRTPCNHKFHQNCIQEWINKGHTQCPMCRAEITMNCLF